MQQYFATFPAGCYDIVVKQLKRFSLPELEILDHDNSSVTFHSSLSVEKLIELRYFTNVYAICNSPALFPKYLLKGSYFRLMGLIDGTPTQLTPEVRQAAEQQITRDLRLKPHTHLSRNDFYVISRSSGIAFLALRLSRAKFKREDLRPGELRPELAHILCSCAGLKAKHTLVDMFAGYGAIPWEAVRGFGCHSVLASDVIALPGRHEDPAITWHVSEADNLSFIADDSVDRVVTDPPWGVYQMPTVDLALLYDGALKEMARILRADGIAVIMSAYTDIEVRIAAAQGLQSVGQWSVLVSGKKAVIYKLQKTR